MIARQTGDSVMQGSEKVDIFDIGSAESLISCLMLVVLGEGGGFNGEWLVAYFVKTESCIVVHF